MKIPANYPVKPLRRGTKAWRGAKDIAQCGTCRRFWDDGKATGMTPAPSGRCPFEAYHDQPQAAPKVAKPKLYVVIEGGNVQAFVSDQPNTLNSLLDVYVVDYDTQDSGDEDLTPIVMRSKLDSQKPTPARVWSEDIEPMQIIVQHDQPWTSDENGEYLPPS